VGKVRVENVSGRALGNNVIYPIIAAFVHPEASEMMLMPFGPIPKTFICSILDSQLTTGYGLSYEDAKHELHQ
jgi:hypothetical protein